MVVLVIIYCFALVGALAWAGVPRASDRASTSAFLPNLAPFFRWAVAGLIIVVIGLICLGIAGIILFTK